MKVPISLIVIFVVVSGCQHPVQNNDTPLPNSTVKPNAHLTETGVLVIARHLAEQKGEVLKDYQPPKVGFDSATAQWYLWFDHKPVRVPGDYFGIRINDRTGDAVFIPGE
jgi:hypothetical protein